MGDDTPGAACDDYLQCTTGDVCEFDEEYDYSVCKGEPVDDPSCEEPPYAYNYDSAEEELERS